jgi:hypothetical protein
MAADSVAHLERAPLEKGDDVSIQLPQPHEGDVYRYVPHEDIEGFFFSKQQEQSQSQEQEQEQSKGDDKQLLSPGQLTWVCKSKGRKHKQPVPQQLISGYDNDDNNDDDDDGEGNTNVDGIKSQQRLELFLRARVLEHVEHQGEPRVRVQYPAGSTYCVPHNHLQPILEHARNLVLVLPETYMYRRCCVVHTLEDEIFLEIGCAAGITVKRVWETGRQQQQHNTSRVVGIDKSEFSIRDAKQRYPELHSSFFEWDVLLTDPPIVPAAMARSMAALSGLPHVVAMDINGNRALPAVLECLQAVWKLWRPRLVIVKSRELYAAVIGSTTKEKKTATATSITSTGPS